MKQSLLKRFVTLALIVTLTTGAFFAGSVAGYLAQPAVAAEEPPEFAVFWEAWDLVLAHFVDRDQIDFKAMTYGAVEGMLRSLGDAGHTTFLTPEALQQHDSSLAGSFEGIGAYVAMEDEQVTIVAPIVGSPAEAAGIVAGDIVIAVDGQPLGDLTLTAVIGLIRGPAGTTVTLTILHPGAAEPIDIKVVRGEIELESVKWSPIPNTGLAYLQITQFAADTGRELQNALAEIDRVRVNGRPIEGIVLDLRNNPGGYLREAIKVASQFLSVGDVILLEKDADGNVNTYKARGWSVSREVPMIVLVNQGTASAGEITAGALQENNRAQLVGETTFGTGTVLNQFSLSDGSAILLGVTNWLTPNGRLIKGQGVDPDVRVEQIATVRLVDAWRLAEMDGADLAAVEDQQFSQAVDLLNHIVQAPAQASNPGRVPIPAR